MKNIASVLIMLAVVFAFSSASFATGKDKKSKVQTVQGTVIDKETGETLAGVDIIVEGTNIKSSTDLEGNFELNLEPGDYHIIVSYISYKNDEKDISINTKNSDPVSFKIELQSH